MLIDDDVGRYDADADVRPEGGARRATGGMISEAIIQVAEQRPELDDGRQTRLGVQVVEDGG